jgi:hypothetical protein
MGSWRRGRGARTGTATMGSGGGQRPSLPRLAAIGQVRRPSLAPETRPPWHPLPPWVGGAEAVWGGEQRRTGWDRRKETEKKSGGTHVWRRKWRASKNGGWEGEFGGVCKMEVCLEVPLELDFCTKPPNF